MIKAEFSEIICGSLNKFFDELGYKYFDDCYFKNRSNKLRNLISFDFDGDSNFRIFIGIDYPYGEEFNENVPPEGARLFRYFTGGSLSTKPKDLYFKNSGQLLEHIERFKKYFIEHIQNDFFAKINSSEEYADMLPESECISKFEIYKDSQITSKAILEAKVVIKSYKNMMDIPKIKNFIEQVDLYLKNHS